MTKAHDILSRWPSRQPHEVSAEPLGVEVDEVFHGLIDAVAEADRELARVSAKRASLIDQTRQWVESTAHTSLPGIGEHRPAERDSLVRQVLAEELACALRIPAVTAESLVEESKALVHQLPGTMDALRTGEISYRHAETVVDEARSLPVSSDPDEGEEAATARAFEEAALPYAMKLTVSKFRQKARKLRERAHPETIEARRVKAAQDRSFSFTPARDGMAYLNLYVEAPTALAIHNRVTETAMGLQGPGEERTLTQLRADVASVFLLESGFAAESNDQAASNKAASKKTASNKAFSGKAVSNTIRPTVMVTVPVMTLLGRSDELAILDGYGPIDRETALELARNAPSFMRLLTHPESGVVLSVGKDHYAVPKDMRRWLEVQDGTCRFPGCNRSAKYSDIDHTLAWAQGGQTRTDNLAHLCPKHHKLKHETGWTVSQAGEGVLIWISPSGHRYSTAPETRIQGADESIESSGREEDPWSGSAEVA